MGGCGWARSHGWLLSALSDSCPTKPLHRPVELPDLPEDFYDLTEEDLRAMAIGPKPEELVFKTKAMRELDRLKV